MLYLHIDPNGDWLAEPRMRQCEWSWIQMLEKEKDAVAQRAAVRELTENACKVRGACTPICPQQPPPPPPLICTSVTSECDGAPLPSHVASVDFVKLFQISRARLL